MLVVSSRAGLIRAMVYYVAVCAAMCVVLALFYGDVGITFPRWVYMAEYICMDVALLAGIYWISPSRMRGAMVWLLWSMALFLGANAMYYRYWGALLSLPTIFTASSYNSFVFGAISGLLRGRDLLYVLCPLSLTAVWLLMRRCSMEVPRSWRIAIIAASVLLYAGAATMRVRRYSIYLDGIGIKEHRWSTSLRVKHSSFGRPSGLDELNNQGFVEYSLSQLVSSMLPRYIELTDADHARIEQFILHSPAQTVNMAHNRGKNLIFIIVESLNADYIGRTVDGSDVTPVLTGLIGMEGTVSALNVLPQVAEGGSSDGQMIYNTGMLPLKSGAAAIIYGDNTFCPLAHALEGYTAVEVIPEQRKVWNHGVTTLSYGYSRLHDHTDIVASGRSEESCGADAMLFDYALEVCDTISRPFMMTIPTISMHFPFTNTGVDEWCAVRGHYELSANERAYLSSLHYFDTCLGSFIDTLKSKGLYDNSVIVIASDHDAEVEDADKWMGKEVKHPIAFIALNTGLTRDIKTTAGQVDIYPTLLDIMGVAGCKGWRGLGMSMLDPSHPAGAMDNAGVIHGDTSPRLAEQWEVSDLMIRSNYFK